MTTPTVTVIDDALQVSIDVDRSRIFAPDGTVSSARAEIASSAERFGINKIKRGERTCAGDKFDEIDQANEELLRQARAARNREQCGAIWDQSAAHTGFASLNKRAVVLDAWARQDLPEAVRFTRKAYIALVNPDECEIGEAAVQNFGPRVGAAGPPSLADFKEALQAARLFEASGPVWIRRA